MGRGFEASKAIAKMQRAVPSIAGGNGGDDDTCEQLSLTFGWGPLRIFEGRRGWGQALAIFWGCSICLRSVPIASSGPQ